MDATPLVLAWPQLPWPHATAAFLLSLLGGLHCAAMCGGFVGALHTGAIARPGARPGSSRLVAGYHAGRLASYVLAGGLAGVLGGSVFASRVLSLQIALLVAGSLMLVAIAASMLGHGAWLKRLEPAGVLVWKRVAPLARRLYPPRTPAHAAAAGLVWGWIPCGMVYAALPLALAAGDVAAGALVMLAFGLGTLPNLLGLALVMTPVRRAALSGSPTRALSTARSVLRPVAGIALLAFGLSGLAHAAQVAGARHPAIVALASLCHR